MDALGDPRAKRTGRGGQRCRSLTREHRLDRWNEALRRRLRIDAIEVPPAGLVLATVEARNRSREQFPGRQRTAVRHLWQGERVLGDRPARRGDERSLERRRALSQRMIRRKRFATGQCREVPDVLPKHTFDGGSLCCGKTRIVQRTHQVVQRSRLCHDARRQFVEPRPRGRVPLADEIDQRLRFQRQVSAEERANALGVRIDEQRL